MCKHPHLPACHCTASVHFYSIICVLEYVFLFLTSYILSIKICHQTCLPALSSSCSLASLGIQPACYPHTVQTSPSVSLNVPKVITAQATSSVHVVSRYQKPQLFRLQPQFTSQSASTSRTPNQPQHQHQNRLETSRLRVDPPT